MARSKEAILETEMWLRLIGILLVTPRVAECKRKQQAFLQKGHRMRSLGCYRALTKGHLMLSTLPPVAIESHTGAVMATTRVLTFLPTNRIIAGKSRKT